MTLFNFLWKRMLAGVTVYTPSNKISTDVNNNFIRGLDLEGQSLQTMVWNAYRHTREQGDCAMDVMIIV